MMRLELKIAGLLAVEKENRFTINEIANRLKEHYSLVHKIVNRLAKEDIITKSKFGKSYVCELNLKNEKTLALLVFSEIEEREKFYSANRELGLVLSDFMGSLKLENILSAILFGSYSKGMATKESDIDIILIIKKKITVEKAASEIYAKYGKHISPILMTLNDFKNQKGKVLIKEVIKNHYVLYGADNFVNLVFK